MQIFRIVACNNGAGGSTEMNRKSQTHLTEPQGIIKIQFAVLYFLRFFFISAQYAAKHISSNEKQKLTSLPLNTRSLGSLPDSLLLIQRFARRILPFGVSSCS